MLNSCYDVVNSDEILQEKNCDDKVRKKTYDCEHETRILAPCCNTVHTSVAHSRTHLQVTTSTRLHEGHVVEHWAH